MTSSSKLLGLVLCASALLAGCKNTPEPLYYYGGYQQSVYSYFTGSDSSASEQIDTLNQVIQIAADNGQAVAPGVHAHLGMLHFETGNSRQGTAHFEQEKRLFPEATAYLDFLLRSRSGGSE